MKPRHHLLRHTIASTLSLVTMAASAYAGSGTWNVDSDGTWNTPANWIPAAVPGTNTGDVVELNYDITTAGKTITIDTAVRLGILNIGDPNGSNTYTLALSSGSLTFDNGASAAQLNQVSSTNSATISAVCSLDSTLTINNGSSGSLNLNGDITNGVNGAKAVTINNSGSGPAIFNNAKTYTGGTILSAGIARIGNNSCFGPGALTLNGGTLAPTGSTARNLTNPVTLGGSVQIGDAVGTANVTLSGVVGGSGTISKSGPGSLILSQDNTFAGSIVIKEGTLQGTGTATTTHFGAASISLGDTSGAAAATLYGAGKTYTNPITVQSGSSGTLTIKGIGGLGTTTFSGGVTLNRTVTMDSQNGTLTFSATGISGASTIQIVNTNATPVLTSNRVNLNVANTGFTGAIEIATGGTLRVTNGSALSDSNTVAVATGALFELNTATQTIAGLNDNGGSGGLVSTVTSSRTLTLGGSGSRSFSGTLQDNGAALLSVTKSGLGTQSLGGANTYTGTTTINGGVLKLSHANALPGGVGATGGTSALLFSGGGVIGLTTATGDFNRAIQGLTPGVDQVGWTNGGQGGFAAFGGDRNVNFGGAAAALTWSSAGGVFGSKLILGDTAADSKVTVVNPISLNGGTRTVFVNDGSAAVDAELAGVISAGGTLIKDGPGTLDLTAANNYGAATSVVAGTLRIRGAHTGTASNVTVSSGATLVLESTGQLSFAPTANGTSNKITGAGTATLNGILRFNLTGAAIANGNSWTIVDAAGASSNLAGVASNPSLTWAESPSGVWKAVDGSNTWTYTESSGTLSLAVSAGVSFESWATTNGIGGAAFTDDSDNDGIDNGTEYAIGAVPTAFTAPTLLVASGSNYTLTYNKGAEAAADTQIDYLFETSANLASWTEVAPTTEDATSVSFTLVKDSPSKFVRLKIVRSTP